MDVNTYVAIGEQPTVAVAGAPPTVAPPPPPPPPSAEPTVVTEPVVPTAGPTADANADANANAKRASRAEVMTVLGLGLTVFGVIVVAYVAFLFFVSGLEHDRSQRTLLANFDRMLEEQRA